MTVPGLPLADRFWTKVRIAGPDECWEWTAARAPFGYGNFWIGGTEFTTSHRMAYELTFGPIPAGGYVCHHCDNPPCVNPAHLFLGTQTDNMQDAKRKGRTSQPPIRRGEEGNTVRLTEGIVRFVRRSGLSNRALAEQFGVHPSTIERVRKRKTWAHVG